MAKKKKINVVYSTNPNFGYSHGESSEPNTLPPNEQQLKVWLDRLRGNKVATVVRDFVGSESDMKDLGGKLKSLCAVGGTAKNGEIMIQGDHRDKVMEYLTKNGYGAKKAGG
jgi:translation initiation factor 1